MKSLSRRARRISRHQSLRKAPALNLVSLMDIFTILVFFLLVNTSNEQELPSSKALTLPASISETSPEETLRVVITANDVLVQGRRVMGTAQLDQAGDEVMQPLKEELAYRLSRSSSAEDDTLTVIADKSVAYDIIKRVIQTSRELEFTRIAFAASQVSENSRDTSAGTTQ